MNEKSINIEDVLSLPLDAKEQKKAVEEKVPCVTEGRLKVYDPNSNNVKKFLELLQSKLNRSVVCTVYGRHLSSNEAYEPPHQLTQLSSLRSQRESP